MLQYFFSFKFFAANMRAPSTGFMGFITSTIMTNGNKVSEQHLVSGLNIISTDTVVELGPGNGWGILAAAKFLPQRLVAVEISPRFREDLSRLDLPVKLEIYGADARDMSEFLESDSVDKLFGLNVVYFLDPLEDYARELFRVMKKGGQGVFGCKLQIVHQGDEEYFKNKDLEKIAIALRTVGFRVETMFVDLKNETDNYHAIHFWK